MQPALLFLKIRVWFVVQWELVVKNQGIIFQLAALVGGPLATLQVEAVRLLCLLQQLKSNFHDAVPLLVFIDCLVLVLLLQKWGQSDFWQDPRDVLHFDVLFPFIQEIRQWAECLGCWSYTSRAAEIQLPTPKYPTWEAAFTLVSNGSRENLPPAAKTWSIRQGSSEKCRVSLQ